MTALTDAVEAVEGAVFDLAYTVVLPVAVWWVNHGLRRPDLAEELAAWPEEARS